MKKSIREPFRLKAGQSSAIDCLLNTAFPMDVDFHPEVTAELAKSADWYAERSSVAARDFLVAVDLVISSIVAAPDRFAKIDELHRSCSVARFPFQIVFRMTNQAF